MTSRPSVSPLRTQAPIRRPAPVERCCWRTSRQTTPCGDGSRRAGGRRAVSGVKANCFNRHCKRSEAIHREAKQKAGLLRCARNDGGRSVTHVGILTARMRPSCARILRLSMRRAWGMPGADAPAASHANKKAYELVTTGKPDDPAFPHAVVLTVSFVISPVIGLFVTVVLLAQNLTPASRRQDHTTSPSAFSTVRQRRRSRPSHPVPRP